MKLNLNKQLLAILSAKQFHVHVISVMDAYHKMKLTLCIYTNGNVISFIYTQHPYLTSMIAHTLIMHDKKITFKRLK